MKEKLLKIINYYGVRKQVKYLASETSELQEAIVEMEESKRNPIDFMLNVFKNVFEEDYKNPNKKHIAEEISDCLVILEQIRNYYDIPTSDIKPIMDFKIDRQLNRIEQEKLEVANK